MIEKLRLFGEKLKIEGFDCTMYYKHDLDDCEENKIDIPKKNIVFTNNDKLKIFFNAQTCKIEIETTCPNIKINCKFLHELTLLNSLIEEYNLQ